MVKGLLTDCGLHGYSFFSNGAIHIPGYYLFVSFIQNNLAVEDYANVSCRVSKMLFF